jgi:hypothetical protein
VVGEVVAAVEMHGRRRRQRDLGRQAGDAAQELVFVERQRLPSCDLAARIGRGERRLVAGVVAELERGRLDLEAFQALDKARPIGAAAEFTVGYDLEAGLLLQRHGVADALVLQRGEFLVADLAGGVAAEGLPQGR